MNKFKIALLTLLFCTEVVYAQYTRLPEIPSTVYNVKDYGAVGDNKTLNTAAIQKTIDQAKASGGKVLIPAGEYLCGPLNLYSRTNLEIVKGATLRLRNDIKAFPSTNGRYLNFIDVSKATDIKISGGGTIDGQGEPWWKATEANILKLRRPQMLYIEGSQRVEISGVTFLNPPNTHVSFKNSSDVYIHDITIQAPANSHNTDGINISAKNCTIEHCTINTGDDNIAINFGNRQQAENDPEVQNMVIKDCTFGYGHGLSIGSFTSGNLKNLYVSNCTFDGTTSAIRIKTARGRGGVIDNANYENITIKNSRYPIFISEYYPREPKAPQEDVATVAGDHNPVYKNISLKNIMVTNSQEAVLIWGIPESPVQHVRFENVKISAKSGAQVYNATSVEFINSNINNTSGEKLRTYNAVVIGLN
jgi:polygalacturonase